LFVVNIGIGAGMGIGLFYDGFDPDTAMFFLTIFIVTLACWGTYFVYYLVQRKTAQDPNARYLGLGVRIGCALIASVLTAVLTFVGAFFFISPEGSEYSLLYDSMAMVAVVITLYTLGNFVNFIVFKPRA
jgi:hypothetical protein